MKAMLTLTSRGVVTLSAKLRRALGLQAEDQFIAEATPEDLLLRPAVTLPLEIYIEKRIREFDEVRKNVLAKAPEAMPTLERMFRRVRTPGVRRFDPVLEASLPLPAKDRPVLAAAILDAYDALVTGDR